MDRRTALSGLAFAGLMAASVAEAQPRPAPAAHPHTKIHAAIDALQSARDELEHAAHDFGGHRVDAIKAIDEALKQLRLALQYADK
jgi:hypothetical protein